MLSGRLTTALGWSIRVGPSANGRSLRNFPMQATGAEMMRLAACLATERGVAVCCPVHVAFLIEGAETEIEAEVARMRDAMRGASELLLPGFPLRSDAAVVRYPERYSDLLGAATWARVSAWLTEMDAAPAAG